MKNVDIILYKCKGKITIISYTSFWSLSLSIFMLVPSLSLKMPYFKKSAAKNLRENLRLNAVHEGFLCPHNWEIH